MLHTHSFGPKDGIPFVFLHGFMGSGQLFTNIFETFRADIPFRVMAPDLPYHGGSVNIRPENEHAWVEALNEWMVANFGDQPVLMHGYSMGGRLALAYAAEHTDTVKAMLLESTRFGFRDQQSELKYERLESDKAQASKIRNNFSAFLNDWQAQRLFHGSQTNTQFQNVHHEIQANQNAEAMAQALLSFSTAHMRDVRKILMKTDMPAAVILGAEDHQFRNHAQEIVIYFGDADFHTVDGAKHRVHVDQPYAWVNYAVDFFNQFP